MEAEARIDFLVKSVDGLQANITKLLQTNGELSAVISSNAASIWNEQTKNSDLRKKCEELAAFIKQLQEVPTQFASGPLWMSEEEEEARYLHDQGTINAEGLRDKLLELGLDPNISADSV